MSDTTVRRGPARRVLAVRAWRRAAARLALVAALAPAAPAGSPEDQKVDAPPAPEGEVSAGEYFPPSESAGGWRRLTDPVAIREVAGVDPAKLAELRRWLLESDERSFAAVVIRRGSIVLEVERGNSSRTDARRVASVSKAICATVLAIASERSLQGLTPREMRFDDPAFEFIPQAPPLSDPRKAAITVKQLFNHTSGICPEATGASNRGTWDYVLGHSGDPRTAQLAFDPGTASGYSTHALHHASLVCETVSGVPYDQFAIEHLFRPLGVEHWWFQYFDGGERYGRHPSHGMGMPARDLARVAYCMLRGGRWRDRQVIPAWFVGETAAPTHAVKGLEMRFKVNAETFSHGWELPARLTGEGSRSGRGIPEDARYKPGSGGQLIAFVPSLDLVVTRQTGASGAWEYQEYVRRACAAVIDDTALPAPGAEKPRETARLPEGSRGIARRYPGDRGIEDDAAVIFVEKFDEGSIEAIAARWESVQGREIMALSADTPAGSADGASLLMTHVGGEGSGGHLYRRLLPGHERVFARFYVKFDADCAPIHHFGTHLGGFHPSTPWPQGGAGTRPRGDQRFTTGVEPFGRDWQWDFYTYWQGMHVHGDGRYWGTPFLVGGAKPEVERARWISVEVMVKMNEPVSDAGGEQAFWIDGRLWRRGGEVVSHIGKGFPRGRWTGGWWRPEAASETAFEGFRWRTTTDLAVNYIWAYLYITRAPRGHVSRVWFDNIVVAREYIGPLEPGAAPSKN